jgi:hypothetical protein
MQHDRDLQQTIQKYEDQVARLQGEKTQATERLQQIE